MEFAQLIADLNEGVSPHVGFEREGLVEYACVGSVGNDVAAEADIDAEYRQGKLGAQRQSGGKAVGEGLTVEFDVVAVGSVGVVSVKIGAFVILHVK